MEEGKGRTEWALIPGLQQEDVCQFSKPSHAPTPSPSMLPATCVPVMFIPLLPLRCLIFPPHASTS